MIEGIGRVVPGVAMALLMSASGLMAQSLTLGDLRGVVVDSSGVAISGALVTLTDAVGGHQRTISVPGSGVFGFTFLPSGPYQVLAEQIGYRPVHVRGVRVGPGQRRTVAVTLPLDSLPVTRIDTVWWTGPAYASDPGAKLGLPRELFQRFATDRQALAGFDGFASVSDQEWGLEGLPGASTGVVMDGLPYDLARSPSLPLADPLGPAFPLVALEEMAAQVSPLDVEWGEFAGGALAGITRRGTRGFSVQAYGDWSPGALSDSRFFDPASLDQQTFLGGLVLAGPLLQDTAGFVVGVGGERVDVPQAPFWSGSDAEVAIAAVALDSAGQSLAQYLAPRVVRRERVGGFGRFSWLLTPKNLLDAWVSGGRLTDMEPEVGGRAAPSLGSRATGTDVTAGVSVSSRLGERAHNEFRIGFATSSREYFAGPLPATFFGVGAAVGTDATVPGRFELTSVRLRDALHADLGAHRLKIGLGATFSTYDQTYAFGTGGQFFFSDAGGLAARRGAYYGVDGAPSAAQFSAPELSAFLQDRWEVANGFTFLVGLRYDLELLPRSSIPRSQAWLDQTGLANDSIPRSRGTWSSRIGFAWRVGASEDWQVRGGVGTYHGRVDPGLLAEVITQTGRNTVRRGVGGLGAWPDAPDAIAAPEVGARLTLLGPDFEPARSVKASLGIARRLGRAGLIEGSLNVRHTDFIPRRHDLNRPLGTTGQDQYGRPLYGTLAKEGSVVAAGPSSPRRFSGFELVSALDPDGYSDYWGVTLRWVQPAGRFLRLYAGYTYSRTTDNWLSGQYGGPYAELTPFPDSLDGRDWASGTSDLDIPHRVTAGLELRPLGSNGLTVAARYRWRSGATFTPGFAAGVDANGDGSFTNDPAFVDDTLPGAADLLAAASCLRPQVGQFADRNSCRDPSAGTLDLRVGIAPMRRYPVEVWIEGFNLTEPEQGVWDHALYAVDPATPLSVDAVSGQVTVPLVANPNFGRPMTLRTPGRTIRVGLRVNH